MGLLPLELLAAAAEEAYAAAQWYRERNDRAAVAFTDEVAFVLERIQQTPELAPPYHHGTRRTLLIRFPYEVVYRVLPDRIIVVAIAHAKRKPGYWANR